MSVSAFTPDPDRPALTPSPFFQFTAPGPPGARTGGGGVGGGGSGPGARGLLARVSAAEPSGVGVQLGSTRFFFPKGEAVDLKRHFKGSSILI